MKALVDACFADIPTDQPVLVAVSGGGDSVALLLLAEAWARQIGCELQAVTVDHGLRPESAAEAAFVASICAGLNLPHVTLCWDGHKPAFGIQEAARYSRYSLLDEFAHEIGADVILTGHTLDDQAETLMMRVSRSHGEGDGRGLAGMSRDTFLYGGVRIIRPLLKVSREALRQVLRDFSQPWIEDPSNEDDSYERVRVRRYLAENEGGNERLLHFGTLCGRLRQVQAQDASMLLEESLRIDPGPVFTVDRDFVARLNNPADTVAWHAAQVLLALAGGQSMLLPRRRLRPLRELVGTGSADNASKRTLAGCVVERHGEILRVYRESRNLSTVLLEPGETAIWDGRLHVHNGSALPILIESGSVSQIRSFERLRERRYKVPLRSALYSTPIIHTQTLGERHPPHLPLVEAGALPKGIEVRMAAPALEHFSPSFDAALRGFVRSLNRYTAASLQP